MTDLRALKQQTQQILVDRGFDLGTTGPARNGVDGADGLLTWQAIVAALGGESGQAPAPVEPPVVATGPIAMISVSLLKIASDGRPESELAPWVEPIKKACVRCEINTIRRVAAFLAQIGHESNLKARQENLNYSVEGLLKNFGRHRISVADAQRYGRTKTRAANQEAIANCIYGGEWGKEQLGNTQPGDGWLFRGVGPLQVTGRGNMTKFAEFMGMTLEEALAFARTLEGGIMAAAWFWEANDINRLADTPGVADETKRINGGTKGLADRTAKFNALVNRMLELERE